MIYNTIITNLYSVNVYQSQKIFVFFQKLVLYNFLQLIIATIYTCCQILGYRMFKRKDMVIVIS